MLIRGSQGHRTREACRSLRRPHNKTSDQGLECLSRLPRPLLLGSSKRKGREGPLEKFSQPSLFVLGRPCSWASIQRICLIFFWEELERNTYMSVVFLSTITCRPSGITTSIFVVFKRSLTFTLISSRILFPWFKIRILEPDHRVRILAQPQVTRPLPASVSPSVNGDNYGFYLLGFCEAAVSQTHQVFTR